jgi:Zn-finger nucleic acid-binding protein
MTATCVNCPACDAEVVLEEVIENKLDVCPNCDTVFCGANVLFNESEDEYENQAEARS